MKTLLTFVCLLQCYLLNSQVNARLAKKAEAAQAYCKSHQFNTQFCFLMDLSIHSGKARFYIYNFKSKSITDSSLVCHGVGKNSSATKPNYSNEVGSNCTSLGKYKIGKRAYSNWGIHVHYKLHGLEKTNSNAFKRQVVLHSYEYVSEVEIYPNHLTMGWSLGCPVLSNNSMKRIDALLQKTKRPTLLWVFE